MPSKDQFILILVIIIHPPLWGGGLENQIKRKS